MRMCVRRPGGWLLSLLVALTAADQLAASLPGTEEGRGTVLVSDGSEGAEASLQACRSVIVALEGRGWQVGPLLVRIQANPYDATSLPADFSLPAGETPDDNAFSLARALVLRSLGATDTDGIASLVASTVAAHLVAPGSSRRQEWEAAWLGRLASGDVVSTALVELLFRTGGDAALRQVAMGSWPEDGTAVLRSLGVESPSRAVGELAVAALVQPSLLDFTAPALAPKMASAGDGVGVFFGAPALRAVSLASSTGAIALQTLRADGVGAWLALRYSLTDSYDVIGLVEGSELSIPLQGVRWAAVVVVALEPGARASFAFRPLTDFPHRLMSWDFCAADESVSLTWETEHDAAVSAYVVESLSADASGEVTVLQRLLVPTDGGDSTPGTYAFADGLTEGIAAYRLLALTRQGLLAEVGTFPVGDHR